MLSDCNVFINCNKKWRLLLELIRDFLISLNLSLYIIEKWSLCFVYPDIESVIIFKMTFIDLKWKSVSRLSLDTICLPLFRLIFPEVAAEYVEGGKYISSEFQLGQVYMGDDFQDNEEVVLYRPVYSCVPHEKITVTNTKSSSKTKHPSESQAGETEASNEEINVLSDKKKSKRSIDKSDSIKNGDRLKPGVVTVDEVSSSEPWEVIALKKW